MCSRISIKDGASQTYNWWLTTVRCKIYCLNELSISGKKSWIIFTILPNNKKNIWTTRPSHLIMKKSESRKNMEKWQNSKTSASWSCCLQILPFFHVFATFWFFHDQMRWPSSPNIFFLVRKYSNDNPWIFAAYRKLI